MKYDEEPIEHDGMTPNSRDFLLKLIRVACPKPVNIPEFKDRADEFKWWVSYYKTQQKIAEVMLRITGKI
jgi:hypothetical protein